MSRYTYVGSAPDLGELGCIVGLALIGAKCTADLLRPAFTVPQRNPATKE